MGDISQIAKYIIIVLAVIAIVYFFIIFTGILVPSAVWYVVFVVVLALFCLWAISVKSGRGNTPSV